MQVPLIQMWVITRDPTDWAAYATVHADRNFPSCAYFTEAVRSTLFSVNLQVVMYREDAVKWAQMLPGS